MLQTHAQDPSTGGFPVLKSFVSRISGIVPFRDVVDVGGVWGAEVFADWQEGN